MAKVNAGIEPSVDSAETGSEVAMAAETNPEVVLIAMHRDYDAAQGGPVHADVHPLEVGNWQAGGWVILEPDVG